jgi:hypothetical protein
MNSDQKLSGSDISTINNITQDSTDFNNEPDTLTVNVGKGDSLDITIEESSLSPRIRQGIIMILRQIGLKVKRNISHSKVKSLQIFI